MSAASCAVARGIIPGSDQAVLSSVAITNINNSAPNTGITGDNSTLRYGQLKHTDNNNYNYNNYKMKYFWKTGQFRWLFKQNWNLLLGGRPAAKLLPFLLSTSWWFICRFQNEINTTTAFNSKCDGKCVVAYGLWGEGLVLLIGAVVCLPAANCESNCSLTQAMDWRIVHWHWGITGSCRSAAGTCLEIVKRFWSQVWLT